MRRKAPKGDRACALTLRDVVGWWAMHVQGADAQELRPLYPPGWVPWLGGYHPGGYNANLLRYGHNLVLMAYYGSCWIRDVLCTVGSVKFGFTKHFGRGSDMAYPSGQQTYPPGWVPALWVECQLAGKQLECGFEGLSLHCVMSVSVLSCWKCRLWVWSALWSRQWLGIPLWLHKIPTRVGTRHVRVMASLVVGNSM